MLTSVHDAFKFSTNKEYLLYNSDSSVRSQSRIGENTKQSSLFFDKTFLSFEWEWTGDLWVSFCRTGKRCKLCPNLFWNFTVTKLRYTATIGGWEREGTHIISWATRSCYLFVPVSQYQCCTVGPKIAVFEGFELWRGFSKWLLTWPDVGGPGEFVLSEL